MPAGKRLTTVAGTVFLLRAATTRSHGAMKGRFLIQGEELNAEMPLYRRSHARPARGKSPARPAFPGGEQVSGQCVVLSCQ